MKRIIYSVHSPPPHKYYGCRDNASERPRSLKPCLHYLMCVTCSHNSKSGNLEESVVLSLLLNTHTSLNLYTYPPLCSTFGHQQQHVLHILSISTIQSDSRYKATAKNNAEVPFCQVLRDFQKSTALFEGFQATLAWPSNKNSTEMTTSMEHWWNDIYRRKPKYPEKNLSQCNLGSG